jgi:hypothetical protein
MTYSTALTLFAWAVMSLPFVGMMAASVAIRITSK